MNYIKWKIEEIKKYVSSTSKMEPEIPVSETAKLYVEKMTSNTYAGETLYENEQFILLDIYLTTNGTVSITYGGLTKTITSTGGVNAQQVFFGTFNGVSDSVETPSSGELIIEGDYNSFAAGTFKNAKATTTDTYYNGITNVVDLGKSNRIEVYSFYNCTKLQTINLPKTIISIGIGAFSKSGITEIKIPSSVVSIGTGTIILNTQPHPFSNCQYLHTIVVDNKNSKYDSRDNCNAIIRTEDDALISGCQTTIIPNDIKSILYGAFYGCTGLTTIKIPNSVTTIGDSAFRGCTGLTSIEIPNSITSIENSVFSYCGRLTNITIPNTVTSIGDGAFSACGSLTNITIPNSVTSIGESSFSIGTSNNKATIKFEGIIPPSLKKDSQGNVKSPFYASSLHEIQVPMSAVDTYKTTEGYSVYADYIVGY